MAMHCVNVKSSFTKGKTHTLQGKELSSSAAQREYEAAQKELQLALAMMRPKTHKAKDRCRCGVFGCSKGCVGPSPSRMDGIIREVNKARLRVKAARLALNEEMEGLSF